MFQVDVNWVAVLAATLLNMVVGALWYSPVLFAKQWVKLSGRSLEEMKGASGGYAVAAVCSLIMAYVLAHFVVYTGAANFMQGMVTGLWIWLGFVATSFLTNSTFAGRPLKLYAIDSGYYLVGLMLMGGVLAAWH